MPTKSFQLNSAVRLVGLIIVLLVCLFGTFCFVSWYFGHTFAANTNQIEVAELAEQLSPDDPQTHYTLAVLREKNFAPESLSKSLAEYQTAAALSPNDFRLWLALGKALEQNGNADGAETALKKAIELAPNYARVQWALGNILLRRGKTREGFAEIIKAAEGDPAFAPPAVATAWQIFDGNLEQVRQNLGNSSQINFLLADFLIKQKYFDQALEIWDALPADEKSGQFKPLGEQILNQILAAKKYRAALRIQNQIAEPNAGKYTAGQISNGGFEDDIKTTGGSVFEWQIADGLQPQIGFDDARKHGGNRSLVIVFNSKDGSDFRRVAQTVVVEPGKSYHFQTFYKSDLKTSNTLKWEIADAANETVLAATEAVAGNADWTQLTADFKVPETSEAVTIRIVRNNCQSSFCPISGKVWFDDFSLN